MKCRILHESKGRMRVHICQYRMTVKDADRLQYYLQSVSGITHVEVHERTMNAVIRFRDGFRDAVIGALSQFDREATPVDVPAHTGRAMQREYEDRMFFLLAGRAVSVFLLPAPVRAALTAVKAVRYLVKGVRSLAKKRLDVSVLDAVTVTVSVLRGDFQTAGSVVFLLRVGDLLDEWTHKKSVDDLAQRMYLNVDKVWLKSGKSEILVPITKIQPGDRIVVRSGSLVPLDGAVVEGEASVNQSSMTGEPLAVHKSAGGYVYAGTVLEDGELILEVKHATGSGRYDRIVKMIEESEKMKSMTESRAAHLADRLVPWSLGATALTYLLTGNATKALAILMVDYSCALKLAMPVSFISAMRECSAHHINVKGGRFLEAVSDARTIVFDKTGTLTHAQPHMRAIIPFGGRDETELLRLAACLEEHFPHSMANAVVEAAKKRGITHDEMHAKVEYIVAHGIASTVNEERVIIGSHHFIFDDEKCRLAEGDGERFDALPEDCSHLFMAIGSVLAAVICIEDPVRTEAAETIKELHALGIDKVVMMTGDSEKTARYVSRKLGLDEYYAEVLPEQKAAFIEAEHRKGRTVIMIGDGINDSPALSEADAGIAISAGAPIAREIADITISEDDLHQLVTLRRISDALMVRIRRNYTIIMAFNSLLIGLGVIGVLPPETTALFHNASTVALGLKSMTDLLPEEQRFMMIFHGGTRICKKYLSYRIFSDIISGMTADMLLPKPRRLELVHWVCFYYFICKNNF